VKTLPPAMSRKTNKYSRLKQARCILSSRMSTMYIVVPNGAMNTVVPNGAMNIVVRKGLNEYCCPERAY